MPRSIEVLSNHPAFDVDKGRVDERGKFTGDNPRDVTDLMSTGIDHLKTISLAYSRSMGINRDMQHLDSIWVILVLWLTPQHDILPRANEPGVVLDTNDIAAQRDKELEIVN